MIDDTKPKQNRGNQGQETIIKEEVIGIFFFNINFGGVFCCCFFNFARVLEEVQFISYKFGLKGSTYTRENTVYNFTDKYFI